MVEGRPLVWSSLSLPDGLSVDTISEYTATSGVTIDGLTIKDGKINEDLIVVGDILPDGADTRSIGSATAELLNLYIGDAGKIYLGLAQDVNLYRSAANVLKTDDALVILGDDTTVLPTLSLLQRGAVTYGFNFDLETVSVGRLDIYGVTNSVRHIALSLLRDSAKLGIGKVTPTVALDVVGDCILTGGITIGTDIVLPTVTGTKIGTATNQLLGFYGQTPCDQPATVADATTQDVDGLDTVDEAKIEADFTSCKNAINAIIDRLQELGLIA